MKDCCGPERDTFWYVTLDFLDDGTVEILWVVPKQDRQAHPTAHHLFGYKERRPMSTPLRINEALLIAGHAFEPFKCVAWAPQDGNGELSLTIIDRASTPICRKHIPSSAFSDPAQLESLLEEVRVELSQEGYKLQSWTMPE